MIRTAVSSLRRGVAAAAMHGEQRQLASHLLPLSPPLQRAASTSPLPCRGFHGGAVSGHLLRPAAVPPSLSAMAHHLTPATQTRMYATSKSSLKETTDALLQQLLDDEATAEAARKRKEEMKKMKREEEISMKMMNKEKLAKADELLSLVRRNAASGEVKDQNALVVATLLARSARDGQEIDKIKDKLQLMGVIQFLTTFAVLGLSMHWL